MHILFLARWYPHREDPMFGLFVQRHAEAVALRHRVSVVSVSETDDPHAPKYEVSYKLQKGVNEWAVYYRKSSYRIGFLAKVIRVFRYYRANMKGVIQAKKYSGDFHMIHLHILTRLGLIALAYKFLGKKPYLITEHWSRYLPLTHGFTGFWRKQFTRLIVKNAFAVTTVTQNLANAMQALKLRNPNYVILPNVVDTDLFTILPAKRNAKVRMIHISCFEDRSKNISGILKAIRMLSQHRIDFECVMVGDGMDFEWLSHSASDLVENGIVRFTGLLQGDELAKTLRAADFLLLFSHYENMPVVILEAFACGLPVVASRVGGIPEMVNDSNGRLVDAGNIDQLVDTLNDMIDHVHDFEATSIRQQVESTYGYEAVSAFLDQLYVNNL